MKMKAGLFLALTASCLTLVAVENKALATADSWKPLQWMRAKGELLPSNKTPLKKIENLPESIEIKVEYSGKGFEFWGIQPRRRQAKAIDKISFWTTTDTPGYTWLIALTDKSKGKGSFINADGMPTDFFIAIEPVAGEWVFWEWEKPANWPSVKFDRLFCHNHSKAEVEGLNSLFLYDFTMNQEN